MKAHLKYGSDYLDINLPDNANITQMNSVELPSVDNVKSAMLKALENPLDMPNLASIPMPKSIAIAVPDETRPTPIKELLPVLIEYFFNTWKDLKAEQISIVVGGGLHPAPDNAQLERILPKDDILKGVNIVSHDALTSTMKTFKNTSRGTPVEVNAFIGEAEFKVVIGQVDPHQFIGMTGGSKCITIGCASRAMIQANHSLMASPEARVGNVETNPARQDLNEAGEIIGINLAVNVCLRADKKVVALFVGKPTSCLNAAAPITAQIYGQSFDEPFDITIASCGGNPKDICLYQAQKGLNHASQCTKKGGNLLLLAACPQGIGDDHYHDYVKQFPCAQSQMKEFEEKGFRMGAHKAFLFSRTILNYNVAVHSELDKETLASCHLAKADAQSIVDAWIKENPKARIALIPNANTMYFYQKK